MGTVRRQSSKPHYSPVSMKFIVVLALAGLAMAEPEAKADSLLYGYPGYGYTGYTGYGYPGYGYSTTYGHGYPYHGYYGKREAEAEAEADPQLLINNVGLGLHPSTYGVYNYPVVQKTLEKKVVPAIYNTLPVHTPVVYNTAVKTPVVSTVYNTGLHTPLVNTVYNTALKTPLVNTVYNTGLHTPTLLNAFPTRKTFTSPVVSTISKREAEADPALVYNALPLTTGLYHPSISNSVIPKVHTPLVPKVYTSSVQTPLLKTVDNAVVPTLGGYIHSSHVGVCTNNLGVRVPC